MRCLIISCLLLIVSLTRVSGQSYYPELDRYRVTLTYPDHTLTAYTKPLKTSIFPLPNRYYYWYSANQIKITQGGFSGKLLNGLYSDFYKNKNLKEKGSFKKGLKAGKWSSWTEEGVLREIISWRTGEMNGRFYKYNSSGKLKEQGRYKNGLLNGNFKAYSDSDSTAVSYYKAGKPAVKKNYIPGFIQRLFKKKAKEAKNKKVKEAHAARVR